MITPFLAQQPAAPAPAKMKIGNQPYPPNAALDAWAGTTETPTVPKFFRMAVAKSPDKPYVGARVGKGDYQFQTYRQIEGKVEQFSSALIDAGIQTGDRVAVFADNSPEWRTADLGVAYSGAVLSTMLADDKEEKTEYVMRDSGSKILVVDTKDRLEQILKHEDTMPELRTVVVTGNVDLASVKSGKQLMTWNDFMAKGAATLGANKPEMEKRIDGMRADDIGSIVYTSGSTGDPKGVLLSHGNVLASVEAILRRVNDNPNETLTTARRDDLYTSILPLGHVMGRVADYTMTAEGGTIAYPAGLIGFKRDLPKLQPTIMAVTPLFFQKIYEGVEKKALRQTGPAVPPFVAGALAGTAAAAVGGLAGALIGHSFGGHALAWTLGMVGAAVCGAAADNVASKAAAKFSGADAFQKALGASKRYYQSRGKPTLRDRIGHHLGQKFVFSKIRKEMDKGVGSRVRVMMSGGSALGSDPETLMRAAGYNIAQGYGLAETSAGGLMNAPHNAQLGTAGSASPGAQVRLSDEREIQISSPTVMSGGYLNKPEKTTETFTDDGWYRTGDRGRVAACPRYTPDTKIMAQAAAIGTVAGGVLGFLLGHPALGAVGGGLLVGGASVVGEKLAAKRAGTEDYYIIEGRLKSQFKLPGGEYVMPEPIEEEIKTSPFIGDAVVVGAPDRDMVGALVVPKFDNLKAWAQEKGLPTDPKEMVKRPEVLQLVKDEAAKLTAHHVPREVVRTVALLDHEFAGDEITAGTNKVKRNVVIEHYPDQIAGMFK